MASVEVEKLLDLFQIPPHNPFERKPTPHDKYSKAIADAIEETIELVRVDAPELMVSDFGTNGMKIYQHLLSNVILPRSGLKALYLNRSFANALEKAAFTRSFKEYGSNIWKIKESISMSSRRVAPETPEKPYDLPVLRERYRNIRASPFRWLGSNDDAVPGPEQDPLVD